jgi:N-acetylmuramoyl-L-alanine amidase
VLVPNIAVRPIAAAVWRHRTIAVPLALAAALTASASGFTVIRVHRGDTLSAIAARYHTSVAALVALNHLPGNGDLIYAGQSLKTPARAESRRVVTIRHTVVAGDTLSGLAARYHVTPASIRRRNHLPGTIVVLGASLVIAHRTSSAGSAASSGGSAGPVATERTILARRAEPDRAATAALIRSTATRWGLDPSLALAISWQESGWQMHEVSGAGAIGAMQVLPSTGAYLSNDVVHRRLDLYAAADNVTAGVALLSVLTHEASSTPQAIAGYYQGLGSVRANGMFASTRQYVADVMSLRESM